MNSKKPLLIIVAVVLGIIGWYAFRPERLFINETVNESFPAAGQGTSTGSRIIARGEFHGVAHATRGTATIHDVNGIKVLRLTDFETSNGPDVQVYLGVAKDADDDQTVTNSGFYHLSALKGNVGDQNYEIPDGVDINKYNSVTIWCKRFGKNFGTAPLAMHNGVASEAPRLLQNGRFHGVAHETKGNAAIYELAGGRKVLRFSDFETSNGPDVQVYLGVASDANDDATVTNSGFFHLAALKGNKGDQNYDIPQGIDLTKYKSVTIWCKRFGKNFGTAPLMDAGSSASL